MLNYVAVLLDYVAWFGVVLICLYLCDRLRL